jgi:alpha-tubulin suppressor-like RCC1 family protein
MGNNLQTASLPAGRTVKKIAASSAGICAILDDNSLYCWNPICNPDSSNYIGPTFTCSNMMAGSWIPLGSIPLGSAAKEITVGNNFACVILTGGTVKCWGANDVGQLGQGDNVNRAYDNAHVGDISAMPAVDLGTGRMALKISAGSQHVCALLDNGSVKCWGNNSDGQLGLEDTVARGNSLGQMGDNLPIVSLGTGRTAIDISAGAIQTCALLDDQTVKCWGFNNDGRLGQGNTTSIGATAGTMGDALSAIQLW